MEYNMAISAEIPIYGAVEGELIAIAHSSVE